MGHRSTSTLAAMHPAAAIFHFVVFAGLASGPAVRTAECLHGVYVHFAPPLPEAS